MPRLWVKFTLLLICALTVASLAARAFGSTQPPNSALRGFTEGCEGKPQPCWYGIVIGVTPDWEISELLTTYGYSVDDVVSGPNRQLQAVLNTNHQCYMLLNIDLRNDTAYSLSANCIKFNIAYFFQAKGFPDSLCVYYDEVGLIYSNSDKSSFMLMLSNTNLFSPFSAVNQLRLNKGPLRSDMKWAGFKSFKYYTEVLYPPPDSTVCYG